MWSAGRRWRPDPRIHGENPGAPMKIKSTAAATLLVLLFLGGLLGGASAPASAEGATYYVSADGSDTNDGTSPRIGLGDARQGQRHRIAARGLRQLSPRRHLLRRPCGRPGRHQPAQDHPQCLRKRRPARHYGRTDGHLRQARRRLRHRGRPAGGVVRLCGVQHLRRPRLRAEFRRERTMPPASR